MTEPAANIGPTVLNPYRGLRPYSTADAAYFYGRTRMVFRAVERWQQRRRFLAVIGPVGSGKTSLVHAGLVRELRQKSPAIASYTVEHPCLDPFDQLARQGLGKASEDLSAALNAVSIHQATRPVLIIDNAEELALNPLGFAQKSLIDQLARVIDLGPERSDGMAIDCEPTVVLILRGDCLNLLAAVAPQWMPAIEQSCVYLPATLELQEWMTIVREPARALGVQVESGLLAAIAHDLGELDVATRERRRTAAVLPLLSFVLTKLWERRSGNQLRVADYQAVGGLRESLRRWADAAWSNVPNKAAARRAMLTLLDGSHEEARGPLLVPRPRALGEWRSGEVSSSSSVEASGATAMVSLFTSGLINLNEEQDSVELCHAVLLDEWPTLRDLYEEEQRFARWHKELATALKPPEGGAPDVQKSGPSLLGSALSLPRLAEAERYLLERPAEIDGAVRRHIEKMRALQSSGRVAPVGQPSGTPLALLIFALFALGALFSQWYWQQREAQRAEYDISSERGGRAGLLVMQPGQDSAALALAIKAVAPSLRNGRPVPPMAKEGLMTTYSLAKNSLPLHGHTDRVDFANFDASGQRVITGSTDRTARIWDARTGRLLMTLGGHRAMLTAGLFSPDGTRVFTASKDHTARVWDARTGRLLFELLGHTDVIETGCFSPEGTRVLTASQDRTARLWDVNSGRLIQTLSGHTDRITAAAFSRDGQKVLTASWDGTARLWDSESGVSLRVLVGHSGRLNLAAFSADGLRIATGGWDATVRLWDTHTFEAVVLEHGTPLHAMSFSPDNHWLATTGTDGTVKLWEVATGKLQSKLEGHKGDIDAVDFAPDSIHLVTAGADRMVRLWDVRFERAIAILNGHGSQIYTAAFSPTGARVVTASYDQTARLWDVRAGQPLTILQGHQRGITASNFSPDGTRIITASHDHTARLWRWPGGALIAEMREHTHSVNQAIFSADGSLIATGSSDSDVRLWDGQTGQALRRLSGHQGPIYGLAFSPDGKQLVSGGADSTLRIWDPKTGQLRGEVPGHRGNTLWLAYSPDGRYLVSSGSEGEIWLRDGQKATPLRLLRGHSARTNRAEFFMQNGELRLISASSDRTVRIWDPNTGAVLSTLESFFDDVLSVSTSPDARRLLIVSRDQGVRLWDMSAEMPLAILSDYGEDMITAAYAPPDGRYFLISSNDGITKVYADDYPASLDGTVSDACDLLRYQRDFDRVAPDCPPETK